MNILDAENDMIPVDAQHTSNFSHKPPPLKPLCDKKEYSIVELSNGLTALLISESSVTSQTEEVEERNENVEESGTTFISSPTSTTTTTTSSSSSSSSESYDESDDGYIPSDLSTGVSAFDADSSSCDSEKWGRSACAVCVGVGSFSDPEGIPGLAHLLEHVVGLGSRVYPDEDKFSSILSDIGGSFHSITECEYTTFYFDCQAKDLLFALQRFSKHLISPILDHDMIENEISRIESEFQRDWYNNVYKAKLILCSLADKKNPAHKFANGNRIGHGDQTPDILLKYLCEFWKQHYSAHRITLAVQGNYTLQTLEKFVIECFANMPCNNLPADTFITSESLFKTDEFYKFFTVEPIEEDNLLQISWVLPPIVKLYKSKPLHYIRWLVVQESEGSLVAYLRRKNWASSVSHNDDHSGFEYNSIYSLFSIKIQLTKLGCNNLKETCGTVFTYLEFLRESVPLEWIFSEMKTIADTLFRYSKSPWPILNVKSLAENMRIYPSVDYIQGEFVFSNYEATIISQLLDKMRPNKANIMITSSKEAEKVSLDNDEQWYGKCMDGITYNKAEIPREFLENKTAKEYFCLPKANSFIITDYNILPLPQEIIDFPQIIGKNNSYEVWHKQDTKFLIPEGCIYLKFTTPNVNQSAESMVNLSLFAFLVDRFVKEDAYLALTAGFNYSVSSDDDGLIIFLHGFSDKLELLLKYTINCLEKTKRVSHIISQELYDEFFNQVIWEKYLDFRFKPLKICYQLMQKILLTPYWTDLDKVKGAKLRVSIRALELFVTEFLSTCYMKCFFQGNISREKALEMAENLKHDIKFSSFYLKKYPGVRVSRLPRGETICTIQSLEINTFRNEYMISYYQYGRGETSEQCQLKLIIYIMQEYNLKGDLRHSLICSYSIDNGIIGFIVAVAYITEINSVENIPRDFLYNMILPYLEEMSETEFAQLKTDFIKTIQCSAINLVEETSKNWREIHTEAHSPTFDRQKKEIEATEQISYQDICKTFHQLIDRESIRKLIVKVEVPKTTVENHDIGEELEMDDAKSTKSFATNSDSTSSSQFNCSELSLVLKTRQQDAEKIVDSIDQLKNTMFLYPAYN